MNRSLRAVLAGTFTLRLSTGLTGVTLTYYLAELARHHGVLDRVLGLGYGEEVGAMRFGVLAALFFVAELALSPVFGVISDRLGHSRVMQYGPVFGIVATVLTWASTHLSVIAGTRLLEGSATAASVPSILGFIAGTTADDETLRGRAVARFEAATLAGLLAGYVLGSFLWTPLGPATFLLNAVVYAVSLAIYRFGVDSRLDRPTPAATADGAGGSMPRFDFARYRQILGSAHVWLLAPTWIAINAVLGLYTTQTLFQLVNRSEARFPGQLLMGGFEPFEIGIGLAAGGLLFFAGLLYWGGRFASLRRTTIILYGVGGGLLLVVGAFALNHSGGLPLVVQLVCAIPIVAGLFVLAGATPAAIGLLADVTEAHPDDRGAVMGLYSVFLGLGQIAGALVGGVAANALGFDGILAASVVLLAVALMPLLRLRRYEHFLPGGAARID